MFRYHRIRKREKRRKLIKEIEELMVKDPEAAKEKLGEIEKDRAYGIFIFTNNLIYYAFDSRIHFCAYSEIINEI